MNRIRSDFKRRRLPPRWVWAALIVLAVCAAFVGWRAWLSWREVDTLEHELSRLRSQATAAPAPQPPRPAPPYESSARMLLQQQSFPWPQALTTLEATAVVGVTPTAVEANPASQQVRLEVQFTDYAKLLEYLETLNAGEPEPRWTLVQSQAQAAGLATAVIVGKYGQ